jgi:hypothetical protein
MDSVTCFVFVLWQSKPVTFFSWTFIVVFSHFLRDDWFIGELRQVPCNLTGRQLPCLPFSVKWPEVEQCPHGRQVSSFLETWFFVFWRLWLSHLNFGRVQLNPPVLEDNCFLVRGPEFCLWEPHSSQSCYVVGLRWLQMTPLVKGK